MPCITTSYPHGVINGDSSSVNFLSQADACDNVCIRYYYSQIYESPEEALAVCEEFVNGEGIFPFDYVAADMLCTECSVSCPYVEQGPSGCFWSVNIAHCCVNGTFIAFDTVRSCDTIGISVDIF